MSSPKASATGRDKRFLTRKILERLICSGVKLNIVERYLKRLEVTPVRGTHLVRCLSRRLIPSCRRRSRMRTPPPTFGRGPNSIGA